VKPLNRRHEVIFDVADIYAWIGERNPDAAERFLRAVDCTFDQIRKHPAIGWGRPWRHRRLKDMRSWRVEGFHNFLVFYRDEAAAIEVYAVLRASRQLERALKIR
jgi:plasmid stabilization system protein ParE